MAKSNLSIRPGRDGIITAVCILLAAWSCIWWVYTQARQTEMVEVQSDLRRLARMAASLVDGDAHKALISPAQAGSEAHRKALAPLLKLREALPEISNLYTAILREGEVFFVLDTASGRQATGSQHPERLSAIMDICGEPDADMVAALTEGSVSSDAKPVRDNIGAFLRAYAPFFDSSGNRVGVVGVDLAADDLDARIGGLRKGVLSAAAGAFAMSMLVGVRVARSRKQAVDIAHEQKQGVVALLRSEARYRSVVDNLREAIFQTDAEGKWIFLNPSWTEITRFPVEDCLGKHAFYYVHLDDRGQSRQEFDSLMNRKKDDCRYEVRFLTSSGGFRWIEVYAQPSLDENNAITGTTGTLTDITQRKESEEALRLNQERLQLALGSSEQGLWDWDMVSGRVYYDTHWAGLLGYRLDEMEQNIETWKESIHPFDRNLVLATLDLHHQAQLPIFDVEYRAQHKTGDWVWLCARGRVIERDQKARPLRMIGTLENIGRRKEAEAELKGANSRLSEQNTALREIGQKLRRQEEESRKLAHIASRTDNAVILTDVDAKIVWVNEAFHGMTGYSFDEAIGNNPGRLLQGPETDAGIVSYMREQLRNRKGFSVEVINYTKAGDKFWSAIEVQPIFDQAGILTNFMAMERDITERRRVESELEKAKESAEAANHAKSDFLAVMSHEIRTPMNGVIGFTNILLDTKLNHLQRDFVENIRNCADSLLLLINDILDFSKIESAHLELEHEPFNLRGCVEEALSLTAQVASAKSVEMVCNFRNEVPVWVRGDAARLRQVMVNLVGNAVKFTASGEVVVCVEVSPDAVPDAIRFTVRDTGIGIAPDRLSRLFKPFSQADSSTTRKFGGTGLGLAICKRLVELMGGQILVDSVPGEGSSFHFQISAPAAEPPAEEVKETCLDGVRVLIVDDSKANLAALSHQLRRWRLSTFEAESAKAALERLQSGESFDLALLDMSMPGMDGIELGGRIRAMAEVSKMPLILLSPLGIPNASLLARAAGIQAVVNKPARQSHLHDTILRVLWDTNKIGRPVPAPEGVSSGTLAVKLGESFPLRILIAEDFPVNQRIVSLMLKKIGYSTDIVPTGKDAVEAVQSREYDLVLMDMHMPVMDGLEATREIRRGEAEKKSAHGIYIIALTADAMAGDREKCLASGMNDYLSKPLRPAQLEAALKRFVQG